MNSIRFCFIVIFILVIAFVISLPVFMQGLSRHGTGKIYEKKFYIQRLPQLLAILNVVLLFFSFLIYSTLFFLPEPLSVVVCLYGIINSNLAIAISTVGLIIFIHGLVFMIGGWYSLGQNFSTDAEILNDHKVSTSGLLGFVLHPVYSGIIQSLFGAGLICLSPLCILFAIFPGAYIWLQRAKYEENLLVKEFGQEYLDYAQSLNWHRIIPNYSKFFINNKKSLVVLVLIIMMNSSQVQAANIESDNQVKLNFKDKVENYTGITFLSQIIGNLIVDHFLKKNIKGSVAVHMKYYSLSKLFDYKLKAINLNLKNAKINGFKFNYLKAHSTKPILAHQDGGKVVFDQPLMNDFEFMISQKYLIKSLNDRLVMASLKAFTFDLPDFGKVNLYLIEPKVSIDNNDQINISGYLVGSDKNKANGSLINIKGTLYLESASFIKIKDLAIDSADILDSKSFSKQLESVINPVVNLYRLRNRGIIVELSKFSIKDHKVLIFGKLGYQPKPIKLPKILVKHTVKAS